MCFSFGTWNGILSSLWWRQMKSVQLEVLCWNLRSLQFVPALGLNQNSLSLPYNFVSPSVIGMNSSSFVWSTLPLLWFFEGKYLTHPSFPNLPCLPSKHVLSKFSPRSAHIRERFLAILSCQIDELSSDLLVKTDDIRPSLQKVSLALWMVLQIVFRTVFSHLSRGLGQFADNNGIP